MSRSQSENLQLFNRYFNDYYAKVKCYAHSFLHNNHNAEEVAQSVFVTFWEHIGEIDDEDNIPGYLFIAAKWKSLNIIRKYNNNLKFSEYQQNKLKLDAVLAENSNIHSIWSYEVEQIIHKTISKLPTKTQEAFYLCKMGSMSHKQLAELHNCTVKNIEYRVAQALKELKIALKDYLPIFLLGILFD